MKRFLSAILVFTLLMGMSITAQEEKINLYVSTEGNDSGNGSQSSPFKTPQRAAEEVRKYSGGGKDITINIAGGTYYMDEPLVLTEKDSPSGDTRVIFKGEEDTVFSGGVEITGWEQHDGDIWKIKLPDTFGENHVTGLFINNEEKTLSHSESYYDSIGWYNAKGINTENGVEGSIVSQNQLKPFKSTDGLMMRWQWSWRQLWVPVERMETDFDGDTAVVFKYPEFNNLIRYSGFPHKFKFWLQNAYELMDTPGEFFYNKSENTMYYFKEESEDLAAAKTVVPNIEKLLIIKGANDANKVKNITVRGITFTQTADYRKFRYGAKSMQATVHWDWSDDEGYLYPQQNIMQASVEIANADNIIFENNTITRVQPVAAAMYEGVTNSRMEGNLITDTDSAALTVGLPMHRDLYEQENGMTDVALRKPVTTGSAFNLAGKPSSATDGDYETAWGAANTNTNNWIQVDLQDKYTISRIEISGSVTDYTFEIRASNDENFSEYNVLTNEKRNIAEKYVEYASDIGDPGKYRYVRVQFTGGKSANIKDIHIYTNDLAGVPSTSICDGNVITNNVMARNAKRNWSHPAIQAYYTQNLEISHNEIYDQPYSGICLGWGWTRTDGRTAFNNKILYNRVFNVMQGATDGGAIYTLGIQKDNEISGNWVNGMHYRYGGIYFDNGTANYTVRNNVVEDARNPFFPYSYDTSNIKIEDNYASSPYIEFNAQNSYVKNHEIFVEGFMPEHIRKHADAAGVAEEYLYLREKADIDSYKKPYDSDYPEVEDYPSEAFAMGEMPNIYITYYYKEAKFIYDAAMEAGLKTAENAHLFDALQAALLEGNEYVHSGAAAESETVLKYTNAIRKARDEFLAAGIITNDNYKTQIMNIGIEEEDTGTPVFENGGILNGETMLDNQQDLHYPVTTDLYQKDKDTLMIKDANYAFYDKYKLGDATVKMKFSSNGAYPGIVFRAQNKNKSFLDVGTDAYSILFTINGIDLQRWENGQRNVIYGQVDGFVPEAGGLFTLASCNYSMEKENDVEITTRNEDGGVRIIVIINGVELINYLDTAKTAINEPGYFGFYCANGMSVTLYR